MSFQKLKSVAPLFTSKFTLLIVACFFHLYRPGKFPDSRDNYKFTLLNEPTGSCGAYVNLAIFLSTFFFMSYICHIHGSFLGFCCWNRAAYFDLFKDAL
jgi:hypothetical protein